MTPAPPTSRPAGPLPALVMTALLLAAAGTAAAAEPLSFVTAGQYARQPSPYKHYPFRVLFTKLNDSQGDERRRIRNAIILKQVFANGATRHPAGNVPYHRTEGRITEMAPDRLRLEVPGKAEPATFFLGIDRIPLTNPRGVTVTPQTVSDFACAVHSLDGRIYSVEILFALKPPSQPTVTREGKINRLRWRRPDTAVAPLGYQVWVNGRPVVDVPTEKAAVPVSDDAVDRFSVRAIYPLGAARIVSDASDPVMDPIAEQQQRDLSRRQQALQQAAKQRLAREEAQDAYSRIMAALAAENLAAVRRLVAAAPSLMTTYLDETQGKVYAALSPFLTDMAAGDSHAAVQPEDLQTLNAALRYYEKALLAGRRALSDTPAAAIALRSLARTDRRKAALKQRLSQAEAVQTWRRIAAVIESGDWADARALLAEHGDRLAAHLPAEQQELPAAAADFLNPALAGDEALAGGNWDAAQRFFQQARAAAGETITVGDALSRRLAAVETGRRNESAQRRSEAMQHYRRLLDELGLNTWPQVCFRLDRDRGNLDRHLGADQKAFLPLLEGFCRQMTRADRMLDAGPDSLEGMKAAASAYQQAEAAGKQLPAPADAGAMQITAARLADVSGRQASLARRQAAESAHRRWRSAVRKTREANWQGALDEIAALRQLLEPHLSEEHRSQMALLYDFLEKTLAADRMANRQPAAQPDQQQALGLLQDALAAAGPLNAIGIDAQALLSQRIETVRSTLQQLAQQALTRQQQAASSQLETILADLAQGKWEAAQQRFQQQSPNLNQHLPPDESGKLEHLNRFFGELQTAHALASKKAATEDERQQAVTHYRRAAAAAADSSGAIDAGWMDGLLATAQDRLKRLEQQRLARRILHQARADLTPDGWRRARKTLITYREVLTDYLPADESEKVRRLMAFLDPLAEADAAVAAGNDAAAGRWLQAARENAPSGTDLRPDTEAILAPIVAAQQRLRRRTAAKAHPETAPPDTAKETPTEEHPAAPADDRPNTMLENMTETQVLALAMKAFESGRYNASLKLMARLYPEPIAKLARGGRDKVVGLLALPPELRAEAYFMVELKRLERKTGKDPKRMRAGLKRIYDRIENASGAWSIIFEEERNRIKTHIYYLTVELD